MPDVLNDNRNHADQHNQDQHKFDVLLDEPNIAEIVASNGDQAGPQNGANRAVDEVLAKIHSADASNCCDKGSNDWHEARQHDCSTAVLLEEFVSLVDVFLAEEFGVGPVEQRGPCCPADPVAGEIAGDGRDDEYKTGQPEIHVDGSLRDEQAHDEEQRVSRQKEAQQKPALSEDDADHHPESQAAEAVQHRLWIHPTRPEGLHGDACADYEIHLGRLSSQTWISMIRQ